MEKPCIGILTWREGTRFAEPAYFRRLIREGRELGATVFLFSPPDASLAKRLIRGFVPAQGGGWVSRRFPLPDVVIDRFRFMRSPAFREYVAFRKQNGLLYANNRLANKWRVHQVLEQDERMRRWLPETHLYNRSKLREMLMRHRLLYVKPSNGTGGRDVLRIERKDGAYHLLGRDKLRGRRVRQLRSVHALLDWVSRWATGDKFIVQQGLYLDLVPDRAVDIRLLIQKNSLGQWSVTGAGVRIGGRQSSTSNLHGGGKPVPAGAFLTGRFGQQRAGAILHECHELAEQTAQTIEKHYGRMIELGLDIGVDVDGRVWLIEVNPKPGREIFRQMGQMQRYRQAIRRPLEYALYLAARGRQVRLAAWNESSEQ